MALSIGHTHLHNSFACKRILNNRISMRRNRLPWGGPPKRKTIENAQTNHVSVWWRAWKSDINLTSHNILCINVVLSCLGCRSQTSLQFVFDTAKAFHVLFMHFRWKMLWGERWDVRAWQTRGVRNKNTSEWFMKVCSQLGTISRASKDNGSYLKY